MLVTVAVVLLFWRLGERQLFDWEEARYAQVAREMLASSNWRDLSWNGAPYFNKPPLLFWMTALSFHVFGESEWAARVPCALMGVGSVLLVYGLGRRLYNRIVGVAAALLLLSLYPFLTHGSRQLAPDAPLLFWSLLTLFAFWHGREQPGWLVVIGVATGLGVLTKGIAAMIPLGVILVYCWGQRELALVGTRGFQLGSAIGVLLATPWYIAQLVLHGRSFFETFIWGETFTRLVSTYDAPDRSWSFYVETLWSDMSHLLPVVVGFLLLFCCGRKTLALATPASRFLACWLAVTVGAVASTQTRHAWYLLPIYPPVCVAVAALGVRLWQTRGTHAWRPWASLMLRRTAVTAVVGWVILTLPQYARSIAPDFLWVEEAYRDRNIMLQEMRETLDVTTPLHVIGPLMPGAVFYSRQPVVFVPDSTVAMLVSDSLPAYVLALTALYPDLTEYGFSVVGEKGAWSLWQRGSDHAGATTL